MIGMQTRLQGYTKVFQKDLTSYKCLYICEAYLEIIRNQISYGRDWDCLPGNVGELVVATAATGHSTGVDIPTVWN
jgi:hypothetical protein